VATRQTSLRIGAVAVVAAASASAALWGGLSSTANAAGTSAVAARHLTTTPTVTTRKVGKLGVILVNGKGRTLYMFLPDKQKRVTCKGTCAVAWPPLKLKKGHKATAGGAARKGLLGTDKNPGGGLVVTYNRWPLYTYILDQKPGQAKGQRTNLNGGRWYVLSPAGQVIKKKP
jgi:predicted lipoprotein with Yx(FWY)xxD motif